jgi:hypothetical protein
MARPNLPLRAAADDETLVELNADQLAVAKKEIGELWMVLKSLSDHIEKNEFTVAIRNSHCGCLEAFATRFNTAVGYDSDLEAQRFENAKFVREANIEIARLERLVGSSRGFDGVPDMIGLMRTNFRDWWCDGPCGSLVYDTPGHGAAGRGDGGGFYPCQGELRYTAELLPGFNEFENSMSDTPVTDKENQKNWLDRIGEEIDLYREGNSNRDAQMLDTPKNRAYVTKRLRDRFPSVRIDGWGVCSVYGKERDEDLMQIRYIKITIQKAEEMLPNDEEQKKRDAKEEAWRKNKKK